MIAQTRVYAIKARGSHERVVGSGIDQERAPVDLLVSQIVDHPDVVRAVKSERFRRVEWRIVIGTVVGMGQQLEVETGGHNHQAERDLDLEITSVGGLTTKPTVIFVG